MKISFKNDEPLTATAKGAFVALLGMTGESQSTDKFDSYIGWLKQFGPIWVTVDSDDSSQISPHAKVLIGYNGDGTEQNSQFVFYDPTKSGEQTETFADFLKEFNALVNNSSATNFIQVVHFDNEIVGEGKGNSDYLRLIHTSSWRQNNVAKNAVQKLNDYRASVTVPSWSINKDDLFNNLVDIVSDPQVIYQGGLNLCGPAIFFRLWIEFDPDAFVEFAVRLFQNGQSKIGNLDIVPNTSLLNKDYSTVSQFNCKPAEWMIMSALRDSENIIIEYDGDDSGLGLDAMTRPSEIVNWLEFTGLYSNVSSLINSTILGTNFNVSQINDIFDKYGDKVDIILIIDAGVLPNVHTGVPLPEHYILLTSGFRYDKNETFGSSYGFDYWTWGKDYSDGEINSVQFLVKVFDVIIGIRN